jgi:DNA-binding Xre family transcriptional regulator
MSISYNGLWEKMADRKLQKKYLTDELKISSATVAKMGKGESVSLNVLIKICQLLDCNIGDIVSIEKE